MNNQPADDGMNDQIRGLLASGMECPLCGEVGQHQHTAMEIRCYRRGIDYGESPSKALPPPPPKYSPRLLPDTGPKAGDSLMRPEPVSRPIPGNTAHLTTDPNDPRLTHGNDDKPVPQADVYLVLSEEERAKGFVRPYRDAYKHATCGAVTTMGRALSETYARNPKFYGGTYCCTCRMHKPVSEFTWTADGEVVGS